MSENPFKPTSDGYELTEQEIQAREEAAWALRARLETDAFLRVAQKHLDELLTAEDYHAFGLDELTPINLEHFDWSIYVKDYGGRKQIGIKILNENGIYDVREYGTDDKSILLSTKQDRIDEIAKKRSELASKRKALEQEKKEKERGLPSGRYRIFVTYPHQSGVLKTRSASTIDVWPDDARETAFLNAKKWISMTGLHNFGLDVSKADRESGIPVEAWLQLEKDKNGALVEDGVKVPFPCALTAGGHIFKK